MDTKAFIERYFAASDSTMLSTVNVVLNSVESVYGAGFTAETIKSAPEKLINVFFVKQKSISRRKYFSYKKVISCLLDFIGADILKEKIPTFNDVLVIANKESYFYNLEEVITLIDKASKLSMNIYDSRYASLHIKCICVLAWHGYSCEDMNNCLRSDLVCENGSFYIVKDSTKIQLSLWEYELLTFFGNSEKSQSFPTGKLLKYDTTSEYLFKPSRGGERGEPNALSVVLAGFNSANKLGITLSIPTLKKNGIFSNIYNDKRPLSAAEKLKSYTSDKIVLSNLLREYNVWVSTVAKD